MLYFGFSKVYYAKHKPKRWLICYEMLTFSVCGLSSKNSYLNIFPRDAFLVSH